METIIKTQQFESTLSQRTIDYLTFIDFITEQADSEGNLIVTRQEEMDKFKASNDIDRELDFIIMSGENFFEEFEKMIGNHWSFETCFVTAKYIDEWTENSMNLIVKVDGINKRFIIDVE